MKNLSIFQFIDILAHNLFGSKKHYISVYEATYTFIFNFKYN